MDDGELMSNPVARRGERIVSRICVYEVMDPEGSIRDEIRCVDGEGDDSLSYSVVVRMLTTALFRVQLDRHERYGEAG